MIKNDVCLNVDLLHAAVKSYYDDIHRYKHYANAELANSIKQAAYTIKWITKFRPIQAKKDVYVSIDTNLRFALTCGFSFLDRELVDFIFKEKSIIDLKNRTKSEIEIEMSFYDKLLYMLRFRQVSGKHFIAIFEALELACYSIHSTRFEG